MALLAEEIVEEWLNRQGYFTIRGMKLGVHEIDILAVRPKSPRGAECRHIEVQSSIRPVGYISPVRKQRRVRGHGVNSARRRTEQELGQDVREWVNLKFKSPNKIALMKSLWNGTWTSELVLNVVRSQEEVGLIKGCGVKILLLKDIIASLREGGFPVKSASGADLIDLIQMR